MRVLVTGGTGYFGRRLVRALRERGETVRVLARGSSDVSGLEGVEIARGGVEEADAVRGALEGCDALIHAAALVKRWVRDRSAFDRTNVEATESLFRAAAEVGVRRIVYTSSFFALGCSDGGPGGVIDENHPRDLGHVHTDYERTKAIADARVRNLVAEGAPVITLYPAVLYGPGSLTEGNLVGKLVLDFARGRLPGIPCRGDRLWGYAYVDDVAAGHLLALDKAAPGSRYILAGENVIVDRFFEVLARLLRRRPPRFHLPMSLMLFLGAIEDWKARLTGMNPLLTRAEARTYEHHWAYDDSRARRDLGYRGRSLEEGLARTVESLVPRKS